MKIMKIIRVGNKITVFLIVWNYSLLLAEIELMRNNSGV